MEELNVQGQLYVKFVIWDDEVKYFYDIEIEGREEIIDRVLMFCELIGLMLIFVLVSIYLIFDLVFFFFYYFVDMGIKVGMIIILCLVFMIIVFMLSFELMFILVVKGSQSEILFFLSCEKEL